MQTKLIEWALTALLPIILGWIATMLKKYLDQAANKMGMDTASKGVQDAENDIIDLVKSETQMTVDNARAGGDWNEAFAKSVLGRVKLTAQALITDPAVKALIVSRWGSLEKWALTKIEAAVAVHGSTVPKVAAIGKPLPSPTPIPDLMVNQK